MTCGSRPRLKLLERAPTEQLPPLRLTPRDRAVILAVYACGVLTGSQIERLFFASDPGRPYGRKKRCQYRLKLLYQHGYLWRDEQPTKLSEGRQPLLYFTDERGLMEVVAEELDLELEEVREGARFKPGAASFPFLNHLLKTHDVRIAITLAAEKHGIEIKEWLDDHTLKREHAKAKVTLIGPEGGTQQVVIIPDGYFWLWTGQKNFHHFLEVDLRTVVGQYTQFGRKDWSRKVKAYKEYYASGLYQQRYPQAGKSMRVLTVTTGETRLMNLKKVTESVAGKHCHRFWFTTFDEVRAESILTAPIWRVAGQEEFDQLIW